MKNSIRRSEVYRLARNAQAMKLTVQEGTLMRDANGRWHINQHSLDELLMAHEGEQVVLVFTSLDTDEELATRTCRTCGRDYVGAECPTCKANRLRFRGR